MAIYKPSFNRGNSCIQTQDELDALNDCASSPFVDPLKDWGYVLTLQRQFHDLEMPTWSILLRCINVSLWICKTPSQFKENQSIQTIKRNSTYNRSKDIYLWNLLLQEFINCDSVNQKVELQGPLTITLYTNVVSLLISDSFNTFINSYIYWVEYTAKVLIDVCDILPESYSLCFLFRMLKKEIIKCVTASARLSDNSILQLANGIISTTTGTHGIISTTTGTQKWNLADSENYDAKYSVKFDTETKKCTLYKVKDGVMIKEFEINDYAKFFEFMYKTNLVTAISGSIHIYEAEQAKRIAELQARDRSNSIYDMD